MYQILSFICVSPTLFKVYFHSLIQQTKEMLGEEEKMLDQLTYEASYDLEGRFLLILCQIMKNSLSIQPIAINFNRRAVNDAGVIGKLFCSI